MFRRLIDVAGIGKKVRRDDARSTFVVVRYYDICSGCSDCAEIRQVETKGSGCRECGYTGRRAREYNLRVEEVVKDGKWKVVTDGK
jgi:hypothetical protein